MNYFATPERRVALATIVVSIGAIVIMSRAGYVPLVPAELGSGEITKRLALLLIAAAFIERAVEVILTPWRAKTAELLELGHDLAAATERAERELALAEYKLDTQRLAFWLSSGFGLVVGASGFRALEWFVEIPQASAASFGPTQAQLLSVLDVVLTGMVLAGGADGVHKIIALFTDFMDRTRARLNDPPVALYPAELPRRPPSNPPTPVSGT